MWRVLDAHAWWMIDDVRTTHYRPTILICVDSTEMWILSVTPVCLQQSVWAHFLKLRSCSTLLFSRMRTAKPLCFDPVSRPCCLPRRLICASGCRWCRRLLNVSFGPSAWFSLPLFLFIYLVYQFVTQMNNGWGRLLPRRHAKLIIVMRLLAKTRSTALPRLPRTPPPPLLDDRRVDTSAHTAPTMIESWLLCTSWWRWRGRAMRKGHVEIHTHIHTGVRVPKKCILAPFYWFKIDCVWLCTPCHIWMDFYHLVSVEWVSTARSIHPSIHPPLCPFSTPTYSYSRGTWELQTIPACFGARKHPRLSPGLSMS